MFSQLVPQPAIHPNSPIYQPTFCLYFTNLETGSHIIFSYLSEDNYHREFIFKFFLVPELHLFPLGSDIMYTLTVFSH